MMLPLQEIPLDPARVEALRYAAGIITSPQLTRGLGEIASWADKDGYAGIVKWRLQQEGRDLEDSQVRGEFERAVFKTMSHNMYMEHCWSELMPRVAAAGLSVISLKGWALDRTVYPVRNSRKMCDWDLLVSPEELEPFIEVMFEAGYSIKNWDDPAVKHYCLHQNFTVDLYRPQWPALDLHRTITHEIAPWAAGELISRAVRGITPAERLLYPAHLLFHVLHHGVRNGTAARPTWLLDAWFVLQGTADPAGLLGEVADLALRWQAPLFIQQAALEMEAILGLDATPVTKLLSGHLRLPERILIRRWRQGITRSDQVTLPITHRVSFRPVTGHATVVQSLIPPPGHTALIFGKDSRASDFWKYRLRDIFGRVFTLRG